MKKFCIILLLVSLLKPFGGHADELQMKNGSLLIGEVVSSEAGQLLFRTPFAGIIRVSSKNVLEVRTDKPVTIKMTDGTIYKDKLIVSSDQGTAVRDKGEAPIFFKPGDVELVNPDAWQLGEGYKWYGELNSAIGMERGNTDSDEFDFDFKSIWRSLHDRYTLSGIYGRDESNGIRDKNQWRLGGKYDRFDYQDAENYFGAQLVFYQDEFADLDLRTTVGPYIGRQFSESGLLTLSGEIGAVYVNEQFSFAEDGDFYGANWEVSITSDFIPKTELYAQQVGVINFDQIDGVLVDTVLGLRFPLIAGLRTAFEIKVEYDGGAVGDVEKLEHTYNFKLGYAW